jgi:hypothetical protein
MRALFACLLIAGCYSPSPPDGAYTCSSVDSACPSGYHCTCGLCVKKDDDAACSFAVTFDGQLAGEKITVSEHEPVAVTIQALGKGGAPASGFAGTVKLSSSWGDVSPTSTTLKGGVGTAMVQLNRETLAPAVATLSASYAGSKGASPGINVKAPPFTIGNEITAPFGWATNVVAEPDVVKVGSIYKMYFLGQGIAKFGFGLATSTDGQNFTPMPDPVLQGPASTLAYSPTVFNTSSGSLMAYAYAAAVSLASSPDGSAFTPLNNNMPVLQNTQCSYCGKAVTFPQVVPDVLAPIPDGGTPPWLMFFSAIKDDGSVSIGRASSPDGMTWTPEPAPILSGDLSGEAVLLSPRVLVDGTVYKMWYSFARKLDFRICAGTGQSTCQTGYSCVMNVCTANDSGDAFSAFCEVGSTVSIGYATSSDGFFWTKSIYNPAIDVDQVGGGAHALLASSVLPTDGVSAQNGVTLYYSTFRRVAVLANRCVPNGVKQATRP